jgi:hypothetical protein
MPKLDVKGYAVYARLKANICGNWLHGSLPRNPPHFYDAYLKATS